MADAPPLPIARLLSVATRAVIDDMHAELARRGHDDLRPVFGFALNALGDGDAGLTTAALAGRLGMTKQGAAKLVAQLEAAGYAERRPDPDDARAQRVVVTTRGHDLLTQAAAVQDAMERALGAPGLREGLERLVAGREVPLRPLW